MVGTGVWGGQVVAGGEGKYGCKFSFFTVPIIAQVPGDLSFTFFSLVSFVSSLCFYIFITILILCFVCVFY